MRKLIATIALLGLALPAGAAECSTGTIYWDGTSPGIVKDDPTVDPSPSVVGQYLWVTPPKPVTLAFNDVIVAQAPAGTTTSVGIPSDAETFAVCYGTANVSVAAGQATPAIDEEVEREKAAWQKIIDAEEETVSVWPLHFSAGVQPF